MMKKKGFLVLRVLVAIWIGVGGLVMLVVLHPLVDALVTSFIAGSSDPLQDFAVRMIEAFFVFALFIGCILTAVTGE